MSKISIIDLKAQYQTIREELRQAIDEVLESQQFVLGPAVEKFENAAAAYLGCSSTIGVASGSDALLLSLMALDIGPDDGVVVPPFTFFSTVSAITRLGATPVFVDIEPETFLLGVRQLEALLAEPKSGRRIKAVIPVHLFGQVCPMAEISALAAKHGLRVVEDVAQAFGARAPLAGGDAKAAGTIGDLGCFSFFPTKNLGGIGDGGLVAANEPALTAKLKMLRAHGEISKYKHQAVGINSRLDSIQAAALGVKLGHIDDWCAARIQCAQSYEKLFLAADVTKKDAVRIPVMGSGRSHVFNYYVIRARRRDVLKKFLTDAGIQTEIYYPIPLHMQPCFSRLGHRKGDFPHAEQAAEEALALPLYPELPAAHQEIVVEKIAEFYRK